MKRLLLLGLVLAFSTSIFAQDGIQFNHGKWSELLATAKKENKLIFVDAFTTWCGPCKWMAANSFPDKSVGEFFNATFINAKIDMEKGEGKELAKTFEVQAYPTLLFVNGDGELVHRGVGARNAEDLLALGKDANDPEKQLMSLVKRFEKGDRAPEFLKNYSKIARSTGMPNAKAIANAYLKTQEDLLTDENMTFIFENTATIEDAYYGFMVKNRTSFYKTLTQEKVDNRIKSAIARPMYRKEDVNFDNVHAAFKEIFPKDANKYIAEFKMNYYGYRVRSPKFKQQYLDATVSYMDKYSMDDWQVLNGIAWSFYENTTDPGLLKKACMWAEKSVKLESNFYNNDTVASICLQLGKKRRAKKYAKRAIKHGKEAGEDVSATEDLLEKIKAL